MARIRPTRREVLGGLTAAGLTAGLPSLRADDKPAAGKRLDFHHHFLIKSIEKYLGLPPGVKLPDWTPAQSLDAMDKNGIGTAFLTMPIGLGYNPAELKKENIAI